MGGGTGTGAPDRRIISPGLDEPSELERDIIYVSFPERNKRIDAIVASNAKFTFRSEKKLRVEFLEFNPDHYDLLIDELMEFNYGKTDYSRIERQVLHPIFKAFSEYLAKQSRSH